ncbi:MAG: hypothetical protein ACTSRS_08240 [Candidatus Helarchaeota archaeon]
MSIRTKGISSLSILFIISAIIGIVVGIIFLIDPFGVKNTYDTNIGPLLANLPILGDELADVTLQMVYVVGGTAVPFGIITLISGIGLWQLKKYGYWLAILISIPLIVLIIGIVFIWYLRKEEIKASFDIM